VIVDICGVSQFGRLPQLPVSEANSGRKCPRRLP
jgi:hypothetical protein